ncbi:hypothetical protein B0H19DRAFT_1145825, partial [Mycena capillaripes]
AGPLCHARPAWLSYLEVTSGATWPPKDGEWRNPPGYPVPSNFPSRRTTSEQGDYGAVLIDGSSAWQEHSDVERFLRIHWGCLSFACRRLAITPQVLWDSFYEPGANYLQYGEQGDGLLYCVKYYDMDGRNGQEFGYAIARQMLREDDPDPSPPTTISDSSSLADCMKVFGVPELLNHVLSVIANVASSDAAAELRENTAQFDPPSLVSATQTLLALCHVNHFLHDAILRDRQGLFLLLASQYGWMLPGTPAEWEAWRERSGLDSLDLRLEQPLDWRGYLLTFLRNEDRVVRNRWRMHRMSVQFARGRARLATETSPAWRWSVGELGLRSSMSPPEAWAWESLNL